MPYTNPDGTAVYINDAGIASGGFVVANSTAATTDDFYAQDLTLLGSGVTFSECTVSSGGVLSIGSGATLSGATMFAGGSMELNVSGGALVTLKDFELSGGVLSANSTFSMIGGTIYSGAKVYASNYHPSDNAYYAGGTLSNVTIKNKAIVSVGHVVSICRTTVESGATLRLGGGGVYFIGSENVIAAGTLTNGNTTAYTSGGVLYNYTCNGTTTFRTITVSNVSIKTRTTASSGVSMCGISFAANANLVVFSGAYIKDLNLSDNRTGFLLLNQGRNTDMAQAVTLAGSDTYIRAGGVRYINTNSTTIYNSNTGVSASGGVVSGLVLQGKSTFIYRLNLADGIAAEAPVINSAGTLCLVNDATIYAPTINNLGVVSARAGAVISGGTISGANVSSGGLLKADAGAAISGALVVSNWGILAGGSFAADAELHLKDKAKFGGTTLNIGKGQIYLEDTVVADAYVEDGVLHDFAFGNQTLGFVSGLRFDNVTVNAGGNLYIQNDTTIANTVFDGGKCYVYIRCSAADCTIRNAGELHLYSNVSAGGIVVSGGLLQTHSSTNRVSGVTLLGGSVLLQSGEMSDTVISGGAMTVSKNAVASKVTVSGGKLIVSNGGVVYDLGVSCGDNTPVTLGSGAKVYGGTISGQTGITAVNFGSNTLFDNAVVLLGTAYVKNTGSMTNVAISGGNVIARGTGAYVSHGAISGGALSVQNGATAMDIDVYAGQIVMRDVTASMTMGALPTANNIRLSGGSITLSSGAQISDVTVSGGSMTVLSGGSGAAIAIRGGAVNLSSRSRATDVVLYDGTLTVFDYTNVHNVVQVSGGYANLGKNSIINDGITVASGASARANTTVAVVDSAWNLWIDTSGTVNAGDGVTLAELHVSGGVANVGSGATVSGATVTAGTLTAASGGVLADISAAAGKVTFAKGVLFQGSDTNLAEGTLYFGETAVAGHAENGVLTGLNAGTEQFQLSVGDDIIVRDAVGNHTSVRISAFDGACVAGATMYKGAIICNGGASGTFDDVTLAGGQMNLSGTAKANRTVIENGGKLFVNAATASFDNTILKAGGAINFSNTALTSDVDTGKMLTIDYTGATVSSANINWLDRLAGSTTVYMTGIDEAGNYEIKTSGGTLAKVFCGMYEVASGAAAYTNGILGLTCSFDGTKLTAADAGIVTAEVATKLTTSGTNINSGDLAVKWDATTDYSANAYLADGLTTGNAWLNIDGFAKNTANVYGAAKDQDFAGVVNIGANAGTVKNLAGGAGLGGSVAGVKLMVGETMNVKGAVYAGGMGDVTGKTETLIEGGSFAGNVFAGALCNYAANQTATSAGAIDLTVNGGTFGGNLYAGAAVKAGAATGTVHTAGDITVELNDGTASKSTFCVYGGGYATGTTTNKVYEAGDVAITVAGGAWGTYLSGRGIFGGVYADKVAASVDKVDITVTGGTMGNVYGGGWAQNGGASTVTGEVSITIDGDAEVANVFGGGSCSGSSYGTTSVNSVSITVAGGDVANNIFAGGQNENNTVVGNVKVTFTGSNDYSCNVFGYGVQASATVGGDKALTFSGYTGTLSGDIGGFTSIEFAGDTAATLSGAAIDNGNWEFNFTGRTLDGDTAAANFNGGTFAGDTLTLLLDATEAPVDWNIASGLADTAIGFAYDVSVGGFEQEFVDGRIASGDYAGWGFAIEDSTLKFKQLA